MLIATLVMFASSTASWALGFTVIIKLIENELLVDPDQPLESKYAMVNQSVFGMNISLPYLALVNVSLLVIFICDWARELMELIVSDRRRYRCLEGLGIMAQQPESYGCPDSTLDVFCRSEISSKIL